MHNAPDAKLHDYENVKKIGVVAENEAHEHLEGVKMLEELGESSVAFGLVYGALSYSSG